MCMLADTQAAHSIEGFKVGVGFAFRKCRDCLATKEMMSTMVIFSRITRNFCLEKLSSVQFSTYSHWHDFNLSCVYRSR